MVDFRRIARCRLERCRGRWPTTTSPITASTMNHLGTLSDQSSHPHGEEPAVANARAGVSNHGGEFECCRHPSRRLLRALLQYEGHRCCNTHIILTCACSLRSLLSPTTTSSTQLCPELCSPSYRPCYPGHNYTP